MSIKSLIAGFAAVVLIAAAGSTSAQSAGTTANGNATANATANAAPYSIKHKSGRLGRRVAPSGPKGGGLELDDLSLVIAGSRIRF